MRFDFMNPTQLVFGAGRLTELGAHAATFGVHALIVIGGGSVKKNGTLDKAVASLKAANVTVTIFEGIEPNPRLATIKKAIDRAKETVADMVIAIGGGSVMDASKVIAAGVYYEGEVWDMFYAGSVQPRPPDMALPVITVPTLAATGSEMNDGAVVTNEATTEKSYVSAGVLYPAVALVDPELTVSVPADQTAYGIVDLITHITESYFNCGDDTPIQDALVEGIIATAMTYGPLAISEPANIRAREQIQWASIVALNGWAQAGVRAPYPVHAIEHVLSAHTDVAHGAGLAILSPAWMRYAAKTRPQKFAQMGRNLFSITDHDDATASAKAIDALEAFFKGLGAPTRLADIGIGSADLTSYSSDTIRLSGYNGRLPSLPPMTEQDILAVFEAAL